MEKKMVRDIEGGLIVTMSQNQGYKSFAKGHLITFDPVERRKKKKAQIITLILVLSWKQNNILIYISWCGFCLVICFRSLATVPLPYSWYPSLPQERYDTVEQQRIKVKPQLWSSRNAGQGIDNSLEDHRSLLGNPVLNKGVKMVNMGVLAKKQKWDPAVCPCKSVLDIVTMSPFPQSQKWQRESRAGEASGWVTRDHSACRIKDQGPSRRDKPILTLWTDHTKSPIIQGS